MDQRIKVDNRSTGGRRLALGTFGRKTLFSDQIGEPSSFRESFRVRRNRTRQLPSKPLDFGFQTHRSLQVLLEFRARLGIGGVEFAFQGLDAAV